MQFDKLFVIRCYESPNSRKGKYNLFETPHNQIIHLQIL